MMPPPVVQDPLPYHHHRVGPIEGVIVHCMGEYIQIGETHRPAVDFLRNSLDLVGGKLSAHCLVSPGGTVIRCVPDSRVAYHAGKSSWGSRVDINPWYLGIELLVAGEWEYGTFRRALHDGSITYNWTQLKSAAWQVAKWTVEHGLAHDNLVRHSDVSPDRKYDPGTGLDWSGFQTKVDSWLDQFDLEKREDDDV